MLVSIWARIKAKPESTRAPSTSRSTFVASPSRPAAAARRMAALRMAAAIFGFARSPPFSDREAARLHLSCIGAPAIGAGSPVDTSAWGGGWAGRRTAIGGQRLLSAAGGYTAEIAAERSTA